MTLLALMRHAETDWNRDKRIQGRTDIPLSAAGRAALLVRTLPAECLGMHAVTSPLARCKETAALLGRADAREEARVIEMHWGAWEGRGLAELRVELGASLKDNEARGLDFSPPGGETPRQVLERVAGWLHEVAAQARPTLAFTHRGVIRAILARAYSWDMLGRPPVRLDWSAIHLFRLDQRGFPRPLRMNLR